MKAGGSTLRRRMLMALVTCFVPMLVIISLLFARTIRVQQDADAEALRFAAQDISTTLDHFADGIYSVSDAFSTDERLLEILDRDYSADPIAKQYAIIHTNNALFESYSRLVQQERGSAPSTWWAAGMCWISRTPTRSPPCSSRSWRSWTSTTPKSWASSIFTPCRKTFCGPRRTAIPGRIWR